MTTRDGRSLTVADVVSESLRAAAPIETAAALAGLSTRDLSRLISDGTRLAQQIALGQRRLADLTLSDRGLLRFAKVCNEALATAEQRLLQRLNRAVFNDDPQRSVVERFDGGGALIERRVTETPTLPDVKAITWLLERRYPDHWAATSHQTIDVTVHDETVRAQREALLNDLERMADAIQARDRAIEARSTIQDPE